jgi:hypothetical protein
LGTHPPEVLCCLDSRQPSQSTAGERLGLLEDPDVALCKAYVNVTLNPMNGVEQKASTFWDHIHRKFCLSLKPDNPSEALPDRDSESLKNLFQRQIQKKMNVYNKYYKQVKE